MGRCGHCGVTGHNKRTCTLKTFEETSANDAKAGDLLSAIAELKANANKEGAEDEYKALKARIDAHMSEKASTNDAVVQKKVIKEEIVPVDTKVDVVAAEEEVVEAVVQKQVIKEENVPVNTVDVVAANEDVKVKEKDGVKEVDTSTATAAATGEDNDIVANNVDGEQWYEDSKKPFPPEFNKKKNGVMKLMQMPVLDEVDGVTSIAYFGETYSTDAWKMYLEKMIAGYPNLVKKTVQGRTEKSSTPHETSSYRCSQTTKEDNRIKCWEKRNDANRSLFRREVVDEKTGKVTSKELGDGNRAIQRLLTESFREDMYGNVISLDAMDNGALTYFDVDHVFPWSRGGRSVMANFEAVQFSANRWPKSDRLVAELNNDFNNSDRERCTLRGINREQFYNLMEYAINNVHSRATGDMKAADRKTIEHKNRTEREDAVRMVKNWLCRPPYSKGSANEYNKEKDGEALFQNIQIGMISDFQVAIGHTTNGKEIYEYLQRRDKAQDDFVDGGADENELSNTADENGKVSAVDENEKVSAADVDVDETEVAVDVASEKDIKGMRLGPKKAKKQVIEIIAIVEGQRVSQLQICGKSQTLLANEFFHLRARKWWYFPSQLDEEVVWVLRADQAQEWLIESKEAKKPSMLSKFLMSIGLKKKNAPIAIFESGIDYERYCEALRAELQRRNITDIDIESVVERSD